MRILDSLSSATKTAARWIETPKRLLVPVAFYLVVVMAMGFIFHPYGDGETETDFYGAYAPQADSFLHGRIEIDAFRGPLYPIAVGLVHVISSLFGADLYTSGKILSGLSAGLTLFFACRIALTLFSPFVALGVLALTMLNPVFVRYTYTAGNDMFFLFILMLALNVLLSGRFGWRRVALTGLLCGLAVLTRYNAIGLIAGVAASIVFVNIWKTAWRRRIVAAALCLSVCFAVYLPWGLYCKAEKGRFIYNQNYENLALGVYVDSQNDVRPFLLTNREKLNGVIDVVLLDPPRFFRKSLSGVFVNWWRMSEAITWPVVILSLIGLGVLLIRRPGRPQVAWLVCTLTSFLILAPIFFSPRFYLFHIPISAAMAMYALAAFGDSVRARPRWRHVAGVVFPALMISGTAHAIAYNKIYIRGQGFNPICELGQGFAARRPMDRGKTVIARKPHFGYYAGLVTIPFPPVDTYEALVEQARASGADYLLFTSGSEYTRPELRRLGEPDAANPGLRRVIASRFGFLYAVEK